MPISKKTTASKKKATKSPGRPKREEVAALEDKLLSVALQEFVSQGYGGASMARIVSLAGISKTTLYSRFSSKAELFRAIVQNQIDALSPSASLHAEDGSCSLEAGLKSYANTSLKQSLQGDMLEVNRLMYSEAHRFPELGEAAAQRTALGIRRIADFIDECAQAEGIPCKNSEAVAEVFILMIRGWFINVALTNRKVSANQRMRWVEGAVHTLLSARSDW